MLLYLLVAIIIFCCAVILILVGRSKKNDNRYELSLIVSQQQEKELTELREKLSETQNSIEMDMLMVREITSILGNMQGIELSLQAAFSRMLEILSIDFGILSFEGNRNGFQSFKGTSENLLKTLENVTQRRIVLEDSSSELTPLSFEDFQKARDLKVMKSAHSLLGFACKVKSIREGYFLVGFHKPHEYTQAELDALQLCADQFAVNFQVSKRLLDSQELAELQHDYIANVSHELRTPLTTIYGYLTILKSYPEKLFQENERHEMFSIMTEECQRLIRLINNLLLSIRVEQEDFQMKLKPVSISLGEMISQTCRFMEREFKSKNIQVVTDIPAGLSPIEGNYDLLYQVFQNLMANSIKFSSKDPKIEIMATEEEESIVVTVTDNGVGIEEQALPKIFQKFYRAQSQASKRPGLGIGLYLVSKLVEMHHGKIEVASELNKGTSFKLRFPKASVAQSISQGASS